MDKARSPARFLQIDRRDLELTFKERMALFDIGIASTSSLYRKAILLSQILSALARAFF